MDWCHKGCFVTLVRGKECLNMSMLRQAYVRWHGWNALEPKPSMTDDHINLLNWENHQKYPAHKSWCRRITSASCCNCSASFPQDSLGIGGELRLFKTLKKESGCLLYDLIRVVSEECWNTTCDQDCFSMFWRQDTKKHKSTSSRASKVFTPAKKQTGAPFFFTNGFMLCKQGMLWKCWAQTNW